MLLGKYRKLFLYIYLFYIFFTLIRFFLFSEVFAQQEENRPRGQNCSLYGRIKVENGDYGAPYLASYLRINYSPYQDENNKYFIGCYKDDFSDRIYCYELLDSYNFLADISFLNVNYNPSKIKSSTVASISDLGYNDFFDFKKNIEDKNYLLVLEEGAVICAIAEKVYTDNSSVFRNDINFSVERQTLLELNRHNFKKDIEEGFWGIVERFDFLNMFDNPTLALKCESGNLILVANSKDHSINCRRIMFQEFEATSLNNLSKNNIQNKNIVEINFKRVSEISDLFVQAIPGDTCGVPESPLSQCCNPQQVIETQRLFFIDNTLLSYIPGVRSGVEKATDFTESLLSDLLKVDFNNVSRDNLPPTLFCGKNSVPVKTATELTNNSSPNYELVDSLDDLESCQCITIKKYRESLFSGNINSFIDPARICKDVEGARICSEEFDKCKNGIPTALGCVKVDLKDFIKNFLFRIALGIAGVFTFLCIIYGAFKINISRGNPEEITKAQEMIRNCIIGLLFIIFSLFILRFVNTFLFS